MENILPKISNKIVIGDGAMGTMLQRYGLQAGEIPEEWVLKHPEKILSIHQEYVDAGSMLIETNTFGGNRIKLKTGGLEDKIKKINTEAVNIAKKTDENVYVAGSVGPTGKMMEPYGQLDYKEAEEAYKEQIYILATAGVDIILIETMSDLKEISAAVKAARNIEIPVIAQMTFSENMYSLTGNTPETFAITVDSLGADIIGVNCTSGIENTLPIIEKINNITDKPLSIFPNAGKPILKHGKTTYPQTPLSFIEKLAELLKYNVKIVGGCCGTTPEHIKVLAKKIVNNKDNNIEKSKTNQEKDNIIFLSGSREYIKIKSTDSFKLIKEEKNISKAGDHIKVLEDKDCDLVYLNLEKVDYEKLVSNIRKPVVIKSNKKDNIKSFLQKYTGKAMLFIKQEPKEILKLAEKFGVNIICKDTNKKLYNDLKKIKRPIVGLIRE